MKKRKRLADSKSAWPYTHLRLGQGRSGLAETLWQIEKKDRVMFRSWDRWKDMAGGESKIGRDKHQINQGRRTWTWYTSIFFDKLTQIKWVHKEFKFLRGRRLQ